MRNEKLELALGYAALGLRVFPLIAGEKSPAIKWKAGASTDRTQIEHWFSSDNYNVGVVVPEGIMVVDIDRKHGVNGFATLDALQVQHGLIPASPIQRTPTGSEHRWFRLPKGVFVCNSAGKIGEGLDVRTSYPDGDDVKVGMVVAAPSVTSKGTYHWVEPLPASLSDLPLAPKWLIDLASRSKTPEARTTTRTAGEISAGSRNNALASLAGSMRHVGMSVDSILLAIQSENQERCNPPLPDAEVLTIARSISSYPPTIDVASVFSPNEWRDQISDATGDADHLVEIAKGIASDPGLGNTQRESLLKTCAKSAGVAVAILKSDLSTVTRAVEGQVIRTVDIYKGDYSRGVDDAVALLVSIPGLRQRSGELVELVVVPERKSVSIQPINAHRLAYLLAVAARWRYGDVDGGPDPAVIASILAMGYWPGVPPLAGLIFQPCMRADGDVISTPGYDHGSLREAIFVEDAFPVCKLSGEQALSELRQLISGYSFASPLDESAALSAILTAATRAGLNTSPGFLVQGHDLGTGKSHLAKLIGQFGGGAAVRSWHRSGEEQDKVILSSLMTGAPCVLFDNLTRSWISVTMSIVLTEPTYTARLLGVNRNIEVSTSCLWLATGNNVGPAGDLLRRVVTIELDARCERPWERKFSFDPLAQVEADRGYYVMLALKVLQDGLTRSCPVLTPLASFSDWTRLVRRALVSHGLPDPMAAMTRNLNEDHGRDTLDSVLQVWMECFDSKLLTVQELLRKTSGSFEFDSPFVILRHLFHSVAGDKGEISAQRLGNWLGENRGTVVGVRKLVKGDQKTSSGYPWAVEMVGKAE